MILAAAFLGPAFTTASAGEAPPVECVPGTGSYAVVVSRGTHSDADWAEVVEALREKHQASVVIYGESVRQALPALRRLFPRYACFVARPAEAGRRFVVDVHRLTRDLDSDPYTDLLWGILTGYEATDALRIARHDQPLVITRGAAGTGMDLGVFEAGRVYSEGQRGVMWEKTPGGDAVKKQVPPDTTAALVETFNKFKPHLFMTSGHATTKDWQIGYSYRNGQFRCRGGQLVGVDLQGKVHPIRSSNPKVHLPVGNCLIGRIPGRDCMALALMRTGGVYQMFGYTVLTWYGYAGWGVRDLFIGLPGRYSLAEAFYANTQALIHQLVTRFPQSVATNFERFDLERDRGLMGKLARKHGLLDPKTGKLGSRDELGLLWDRDTVAFYGDPAWDARLKPQPLPWDLTLTEEGERYTIELIARKDCAPRRPPVLLFPHRVRDVEVVQGAELEPAIADNFILLPKPAKLKAGARHTVVFRATRAEPRQ
jgi:zinc protease